MTPLRLVPGVPLAFLALATATARADPTTPDRSASTESAPSGAAAVRRLDLTPYAGWALVANSVTAGFIGANATFRFNRHFALGADLAWYGLLNRSEGAKPTYPLNETRDSEGVEFSYVPWPLQDGREGVMGAFEPYAIAGLGLVHTRPESVIDPTVRSFNYNPLASLTLGVGGRLFVAERVALAFEARGLLYFEKLENKTIAAAEPGTDVGPQNPATWYAPNSMFAQNFQIRVGASFFVF